MTGAAQQNASAEKQARDAEYQLQLWLEHIMAHPLFASVDTVAALRDFLTRKGVFLASAVAQYVHVYLPCRPLPTDGSVIIVRRAVIKLPASDC